MKINKLKAISLAVCCLVASLGSETQCMDNQPDILESATGNSTANMYSSSQNEIDELEFEATPSQLINLEGPQTSWTSHLISPVRTTVQMAHDFLSLCGHSPQKGILVGLLLTTQILSTNASLCMLHYTLDKHNTTANMTITGPGIDCGACNELCSVLAIDVGHGAEVHPCIKWTC